MDDGRQRDNIKCNMLCYGCCVRHWRTWRKCRSDASIPPTRSSENVNERVLAIGIENVPQKVIVTYSGMKDASTRKIWPIAFYWQQWIKLTMLSNSYTTNIKRKREKWNERDVMTCNFFIYYIIINLISMHDLYTRVVEWLKERMPWQVATVEEWRKTEREHWTISKNSQMNCTFFIRRQCMAKECKYGIDCRRVTQSKNQHQGNVTRRSEKVLDVLFALFLRHIFVYIPINIYNVT